MLNSLKCIIQCLERTISPDKKILAESQLMLEKFVQENVGQFISNMSIILADQKNSTVARQAAGLQLKNCLTIRDEFLKKEYQQRWSNLPETTRKTVRKRLVSSLGTENIYPSCAAQCLAYIGAAELLLPETLSSSEILSLRDLISELSCIVSQKASNEHRKEAALESIACICQEIRPEVLANFYESILHPILICMNDSKSSTDRIRVAAARALLSSLECIYPSFETEEGRNAIMQVVCDGTQSSVAEESVIWLEILVKIGSFYYHHLREYMDSAILPITLSAILSPDSNISLQGIEFWTSIAEIEFNLASGSYDPTLVVPSSFYAEQALHKLVPHLMYVLTIWQDESANDIDDLEDWTPFKGACSCLLFLAQCCSSNIDLYVTPQVCNLIKHPNWRQRNAALWAISAILEELDPKRAFSEILPFMASVWELTNDQRSAKVRYSAHVLMSKVFEVCPSLIPASLSPLIIGLLQRLDDVDHRVAAKVCNSLSSLVKAIYKYECEKEQDGALPSTSLLSSYYKRIVEKLLKCAAATALENLKVAAYQALGDVLLSSSNDCYRIVKSTIQSLIVRLRDEVKDSDNESYFTCVTLSRVLCKLKSDEIQIRHELMVGLISILQSGVMNENVFLVTSTAISLLPLNELKVQLPDLITYFKSAVELPDACPVIGLIGDLFRALGTESLPYLDSFCQTIFHLLAQEEMDTKLRSECTATLMDIANSVGMQHFQPYVDRTLNQLQYASSITIKKNPEHEELQEIMLQLYSTLFIYTCDQVDKLGKNQNQEFTSQLTLMDKCLAGLSEFIAAVVDKDTSDVIILASAELVGIIFKKLGAARAMKSLELNIQWLLNTAVIRVRTCESNDYSADCELNFTLSALEAFNALSIE